MEKKQFLEQIAYLELVYNKKYEEEQIKAYWRFLRHLPIEKFKIACENVAKKFEPTSTVPLPAVPHFLKYCGEDEESNASIAIAILKRSIRKVGPYESIIFKDAALNYAVNSYGGWVHICNWTDKDWNLNEQKLINTYKAASIGGYKDTLHLPGISEKEHGFFKLHFIKRDGETWGANKYTADTLAIDLAKMQKKIGKSTPEQNKAIDDIVKKCLPGEIEEGDEDGLPGEVE